MGILRLKERVAANSLYSQIVTLPPFNGKEYSLSAGAGYYD
jgi:hypothetical protein